MRAQTSRPANRAETPFNGLQSAGILLAFVLLVVLRLPQAWGEGRFQDEEATVFLAYAWHFPWAEALFRPFGGYLNLAANGSTLLVATLVKSGLLPLERAPYGTMLLGLAAQLVPPLLVLRGRADWLPGRIVRLIGVLIMGVAPAIEEVFFNILHIQFHLALATALIVALDVPRTRGGTVLTSAVLALAPLCGPGAIVFAPLFLARAALDRDPGRARQFAVILLFSAVQLLFFYSPNPVRGAALDPGSIGAAVFIRLVALPVLGDDLAHLLAAWITLTQKSAMVVTWLLALLGVVALGALLLTAWRQRSNAMWLILAAVGLAVVTYAAGIASGYRLSAFVVHSGPRYNYIPLVLLGLAVVGLAALLRSRGQVVLMALALLLLLNGALDYLRPMGIYAAGPSWRGEVKAWRADPNHPLAVWPRPWAADLSGRARRCVPVSVLPRDNTAPRYCENGWNAAFKSGGK